MKAIILACALIVGSAITSGAEHEMKTAHGFKWRDRPERVYPVRVVDDKPVWLLAMWQWEDELLSEPNQRFNHNPLNEWKKREVEVLEVTDEGLIAVHWTKSTLIKNYPGKPVVGSRLIIYAKLVEPVAASGFGPMPAYDHGSVPKKTDSTPETD